MSKLNLTNPFMEDMQNLKTGTKTAVCAKGQAVSLVDDDTGEVKGRGYNAVIKERPYDREQFVKIYGKGRAVLPLLSVSATKILWFLIDCLGYDDVVILNMDKAKRITGYKSETVIYRAIAELKKYKIIANAYQNGLYYINPVMFYRGNRLRLI